MGEAQIASAGESTSPPLLLFICSDAQPRASPAGIPFDAEDSFTLRRVAALRLHENTEEVTAAEGGPRPPLDAAIPKT